MILREFKIAVLPWIIFLFCWKRSIYTERIFDISRIDMTEWVSVMETILQRCKEACTWLVEFLSMEGQSYLKWVVRMRKNLLPKATWHMLNDDISVIELIRWGQQMWTFIVIICMFVLDHSYWSARLVKWEHHSQRWWKEQWRDSFIMVDQR